jgi:hypothetical protein
MKKPVKQRLLVFLFGLIVVPFATYLVILFARGYRPNFINRQIQSTGLLVAQSYPDGANIYLNNELKSATNTTLNLPPQKYAVEIKKDGFTSWKKDLQVEAEIVTRATAWLFPSVPSLKAITSTGSLHPTASPDGTKVAYFVPNKKLFDLLILDLNESPLGLINRDPKKLITSSSLPTNILWSPDSRQILLSASSSATLVELSNSQSRTLTDNVQQLLNGWKLSHQEKEQAKFSNLPKKLQEILATTSAQITWSPKENKLLYVATASATIPNSIVKPLPGSSTQSQNRVLSPGNVYVYDLEEDRNFQVGVVKITPTPTPSRKTPTPTPSIQPQTWNTYVGYSTPGGFSWFPSSSHIYKVEGNKITITEYDGQNPTIVYAGPMEENLAIPYPSAKQILILTNLNPELTQLSNLYAISLR